MKRTWTCFMKSTAPLRPDNEQLSLQQFTWFPTLISPLIDSPNQLFR